LSPMCSEIDFGLVPMAHTLEGDGRSGSSSMSLRLCVSRFWRRTSRTPSSTGVSMVSLLEPWLH
jgi:hypothetical protein